MNALKEGNKPDNIIGQFGVGFYSAFMVGDEVKVYSKSAYGAPGIEWISDGFASSSSSSSFLKKEKFCLLLFFVVKFDFFFLLYSQISFFDINQCWTLHCQTNGNRPQGNQNYCSP